MFESPEKKFHDEVHGQKVERAGPGRGARQVFRMRLRVLGLTCGAKDLDGVIADDTVDSLKKKLYEATLVDLQPSAQRLIFDGKTLVNGNELLSDVGIGEGGVVVVVRRRGGNGGKDWQQRERSSPSPDLSLINRVLGSQVAASPPSAVGSAALVGSLDTQADCAGSEVLSSVEESLQGLRIDSAAARTNGATTSTQALGQGLGVTLPEPDASALQQLLEMGFPERRARKALLLNRNHPQAAMEWLLEVGDSPEADSELTGAQIRQLVNVSGGMGQPIWSRRREAPPEPVEPDEAVVQQIIEMGFPREDVLAALAATHNDHEAACVWLLGERGGGIMGEEHHPHESHTLDGTGTQGDPESMHMLLSDILSHPAIQEGMQSERVLQAFQAMIEDPSSAHDYLNDPEVGPILLRVHAILSRMAEQQTAAGLEG